MARPTFDHDTSTSDSPSVAMPVEELRGRSVWTDAGEELGKLRELRTDGEGRITGLEVQHGWMFGQRYVVEASAMRIEEGSVVVPSGAVEVVPKASRRSGRRSEPVAARVAAPVLVEGRTGAQRRFGGLSPAAGMIGALVALASAILLGGVMSAIFSEVRTVAFDGSFTSSSDLWSDAMLAGAVTLALSLLVGGWAAGRVARFDGGANGVSVTGWLIVLGAACAALGALIGDSANVFDTADVPSVAWSDISGWAGLGMVIAVAIMLVFSTIGGALGEWYNRKVDRSMLRPARIGVVGGVDYSDGSVVSQSELAEQDVARRDAGVVGTPAGAPVAPRPMSTSDSAADVRRPD